MKRCILVILAALLLIFLVSCSNERPYEIDRSDPLPVENREATAEMVSTPDSSCFSEVGYADGSLFVTFRENGYSYEYKGVPQKVYDALWAADSMGGYYNTEIKGYYECHRLS